MAHALLAALLLALAIGVLPLSWVLRLSALVLLLIGTSLLVRRHRPERQRWPVALALLLLLLSFGWGWLGQPRPPAGDPLLTIPAGRPSIAVLLEARLLEDPRPSAPGGRCQALAQVQGGRSQLQFDACPTLQQGWRLQVAGQLRRPEPAPHPVLSSAMERLSRQGAWSELQVEHWRLLERCATPVADLRRRMAKALSSAAGADAGAVLAALVLGSAVAPAPPAVAEAFRAAGLSHALAASGFHLTVLLGAVMLLGRGGPRLWRWTLALGAMGLFLLLAGPQPSVVRAVLMGAMAFAVQDSGRRTRPLGVLLLGVLLMLLYRPAWLLDVGFQLSVAATAGLMLSATPLEQLLLRWRLPGWGAGAIAVPLAASLWTLPLQLLHFGALPLYAVPANLLVAPLLTPLTLGAMAMALAAVILPPLVPLLGWLLVPLARLLLWLVQQMAAWPLATWQLGRLPAALALLLALGMLPWLLPRLRRWRLAGAALLGLSGIWHGQLLLADQLLLVHDGARQWLLARHGGRGGLLSSRADAFSCRRARQLVAGHGLQRLDWVLLLDPVPPEQPACWAGLTPTLLAAQNGQPPLLTGQRLHSEGLIVQALAGEGQPLRLQAGGLRWLLLPDRQSWWGWRQQSSADASELDGLWLGFRPRLNERRQLPPVPPDRRWIPADGSGSGWRQS